jgi:hypothetical protein
MADKPIIFSAPMVRALIEGSKTQTRRVLKEQPAVADAVFSGGRWQWRSWKTGCFLGDIRIPYAPGDRLYVREAWRTLNRFNDQPVPVGAMVAFEADQPYAPGANGAPISNGGRAGRLRPSIHMPRWASRITLTVTEVRVQRLQEISEADARAEGCVMDTDGLPDEVPHESGVGFVGWDSARDWYADLWESLHGPDAWSANPRVVAVSFTVQQGNIDA